MTRRSRAETREAEALLASHEGFDKTSGPPFSPQLGPADWRRLYSNPLIRQGQAAIPMSQGAGKSGGSAGMAWWFPATGP